MKKGNDDVGVGMWIRKASTQLIGEECTGELLDRMNVRNIACLRLAASKGLSLGIILGAMVVKVPQILKVLLSRSVEGISFLAVALETVAASIAFAYNFRAHNPFTTYGETLFMTFQNVLLLLLMGLYRGQTMRLILLFSLYSVMMSSLLIPNYVTDATLRSLQALTIPLGMASRLPQIWTIWRRGDTGQLSALTVFLIWAGSMARVYTCRQETPNDWLLLAGFLLSALLNTVILGQIIYYWKSSKVERKTSKAKKLERHHHHHHHQHNQSSPQSTKKLRHRTKAHHGKTLNESSTTIEPSYTGAIPQRDQKPL